MRRTDVEVLLQPFDGVDQRVGHHDPADSPPGHRPVLREAVHHDGIVVDVEHPRRGRSVDDAVVDLVGDHGDAARPTVRGHLPDRLRAQHRSRRVGRRREHEPGEITGAVEMGGGRCPSTVGPHRNRDRGHPEGDQCVAVTRIPGLEHADAVARPEQRQEGEGEPGGGSGDDEHPIRGDALVPVREPPAQRLQAAGVRVAQRAVELLAHGVTSHDRQRRRGLADLEVEHSAPGRLQCARFAAHRHRMERRNSCGANGGLDHSPIVAFHR